MIKTTEEKVPMWARKPKANSEVVATNRGWVKKDTGELLVSVRDLDKKLADYLGVSRVIFEQETSTIVVDEVNTEELPTSDVFIDGKPEQVAVIPAETIIAPATVLDATPVVDEIVHTETVVVGEPKGTVMIAPSEEVKDEVKQDEPKQVAEVVQDKEEPVIVVEEVPVKKGPGRPKKVKPEETQTPDSTKE